MGNSHANQLARGSRPAKDVHRLPRTDLLAVRPVAFRSSPWLVTTAMSVAGTTGHSLATEQRLCLLAGPPPVRRLMESRAAGSPGHGPGRAVRPVSPMTTGGSSGRRRPGGLYRGPEVGELQRRRQRRCWRCTGVGKKCGCLPWTRGHRSGIRPQAIAHWEQPMKLLQVLHPVRLRTVIAAVLAVPCTRRPARCAACPVSRRLTRPTCMTS